MQNLDRRIAALESAGGAKLPRVIETKIGETPEEACARLGVSPDDPGVLVMHRFIVDPPVRAHA